MLHAGRTERKGKRRKLSAAAIIRCLGPALLAVALLVQNYVAERHFHPLTAATGIAHAQASVDALKTPFVPTSDQHGDDCPLCQVLGLGATTDVPQGVHIIQPLRTVTRMPASSEIKPLGIFRAGHQPRGPPVSLSII
jgi:hypothetical protein